MEGSPPEVVAEGESAVVAAEETPTGQSRLAYRLAATVMLVNSAVMLLFALLASSPTASTVYVIIDSALAIGLLEFRHGARVLVLLRSGLGVVLALATGAILLLQSDSAPAEMVLLVGLQLAYSIPLILLLTGKSSTWRLGLAVAIFAIGLLAGRVWEPFVGVINGETADVIQIAHTASVAAAAALLVIAVVVKHKANSSRLRSWVIALLAIASVAALALSSLFLREPGQIFGTWLLTVIWAAVAAFVLVKDNRRRRTAVIVLTVLAVGLGALVIWFLILAG